MKTIIYILLVSLLTIQLTLAKTVQYGIIVTQDLAYVDKLIATKDKVIILYKNSINNDPEPNKTKAIEAHFQNIYYKWRDWTFKLLNDFIRNVFFYTSPTIQLYIKGTLKAGVVNYYDIEPNMTRLQKQFFPEQKKL